MKDKENNKDTKITKNNDLLIAIINLVLFFIGTRAAIISLISLILSIILIIRCIKHIKDKIINKSKSIIALIISTMIVIITIVSFIISFLTINNVVQKSKLLSYVSSYRVIQREVNKKVTNAENPECDDNCDDMYPEYRSVHYNFKVTDKGSYYEIYFETEKNTKFTDKYCKSLQDSKCSGNKIIGRVSKN